MRALRGYLLLGALVFAIVIAAIFIAFTAAIFVTARLTRGAAILLRAAVPRRAALISGGAPAISSVLLTVPVLLALLQVYAQGP
jgi:hypothetical protein